MVIGEVDKCLMQLKGHGKEMDLNASELDYDEVSKP
jgi:hypothetical protein